MFTDLTTMDTEVFPNYFLVAFKNLANGKVLTCQARGDTPLTDRQCDRLEHLLANRDTFGFNSRNYDIPIIASALAGKPPSEIYKLSEFIIKGGRQWPGWKVMKKFGLAPPTGLHFDIQEPAPAVMVSLKLYGGRMHSTRLQDLPIAPGTILTKAQMIEIKDYCINDLDTTIDLYRKIEDRIKLRIEMGEKYEQALLSKSDAQIAETVLRAANRTALSEVQPAASFKYKVPRFIKFRTPQLREALATIRHNRFRLNAGGAVKLPPEISGLKLQVGMASYQIGIGGLHSKEKSQAVVPTGRELLVDRDVVSYYPYIILNCGLYPPQFGPGFLGSYREIVETRLQAKREGNKVVADSLKIVINGSFGKLGSKYSALYAPDLMLAVTMTGQLSLLMLIERLELEDFRVVSANTDGFVTLVPKDRYARYDAICQDWELDTAFELEETRYRALYARDVNNYLALTKSGFKGKGIFADPGLSKNPVMSICVEAAVAYLNDGTPIVTTIQECGDIRKFLTVRTVKGGAVWRGQYLGRVVRWVWGAGGEAITYQSNGNKVATSDGAVPVMDFDEIEFDELDIDYRRYLEATEEILTSVGATI